MVIVESLSVLYQSNHRIPKGPSMQHAHGPFETIWLPTKIWCLADAYYGNVNSAFNDPITNMDKWLQSHPENECKIILILVKIDQKMEK